MGKKPNLDFLCYTITDEKSFNNVLDILQAQGIHDLIITEEVERLLTKLGYEKTHRATTMGITLYTSWVERDKEGNIYFPQQRWWYVGYALHRKAKTVLA